MKEIKPVSDKVLSLLDSICDSIMDASDKELVKDIDLFEASSDDITDELHDQIAVIIKRHRQRALVEARNELNRIQQIAKTNISKLIPSDPIERRTLLENILGKGELPSELTVAFREGRELSDADIESILNDLEQLGFLDN